MDTKPLELEALNHIKSLVEKYGYNCCELDYDKNGGDFLILKEKGGNVYYGLGCQSKGRKVFPNSSNVIIPKGYVIDGFMAFVYVRPQDPDETKVYLYTANDIRISWKYDGKSYLLYLPKDFTSRKENEKYYLNKERSEIIGGLLESVSREIKHEEIQAVENCCSLWRETGGLPSVEYLCDVFKDDDLYYIFDTRKFIFLLCAVVIQNKDDNCSFPIDWAFLPLKNISGDTEAVIETNEGHLYYSNVTTTYYKTWVSEILSQDGQLLGYHLHMGDDEESINAYVMKDGEYGVAYKSDILGDK